MRDKADTAEWRIARIASRQHGVISARQLLTSGLTRDGVMRRVHAGGLHRMHRGVYAVGYANLAIETRWMAAVLACGNVVPQPNHASEPPPAPTTRSVLDHWGAVLSHCSAAVLWRLLPSADGRVDVSVSGIGGKMKRQGVHVHRSRTLTPEMVTSHRGIPVTTPARTIADLRRAASTRGCPAAIAPWELRRAIRQAGVLGLSIGSEVSPDRTRSELERLFLKLCRQHGFPAPEVNVWVGSLEVDFLWGDRRLILETDGYRYHRGRAAFEDDRDRDLRLRTLGYEVIRLSYRQVVDNPEQVAAVLKTRLR
jgi:very-short-patch-repair endonuclease